jgi:hypothetical protein
LKDAIEENKNKIKDLKIKKKKNLVHELGLGFFFPFLFQGVDDTSPAMIDDALYGGPVSGNRKVIKNRTVKFCTIIEFLKY